LAGDAMGALRRNYVRLAGLEVDPLAWRAGLDHHGALHAEEGVADVGVPVPGNLLARGERQYDHAELRRLRPCLVVLDLIGGALHRHGLPPTSPRRSKASRAVLVTRRAGSGLSGANAVRVGARRGRRCSFCSGLMAYFRGLRARVKTPLWNAPRLP